MRSDPAGLHRDAGGLVADNNVGIFIYNERVDIWFHVILLFVFLQSFYFGFPRSFEAVSSWLFGLSDS